MDQTARNPGAAGTGSPPLAAATTRVNLDGSLRGGGSAGRDAPRRARRRARAGGAAAKGEALMDRARIRTKPGGAAGASGRERARGARRNERGVDAFLLSKSEAALPTAGNLWT